MNPANFPAALKAFTRRQPFRKFVIEHTNGDRFRVDHPEALVLRGNIIMHLDNRMVHRVFDSESVCQLRDLNAD